MMEWMQQFMNPANANAIAGALAQKSAPPPDVLAFAQNAQGAQPTPMPTPMNPGVSGFAQALNPAGAQGAPMLPPPQAGFGPDFSAPALQVPAQAPQVPASPGLTAAQMGQLVPEQTYPELRPPPPPGLAGGNGVREAQLLATVPMHQRASLAQLLYGRR